MIHSQLARTKLFCESFGNFEADSFQRRRPSCETGHHTPQHRNPELPRPQSDQENHPSGLHYQRTIQRHRPTPARSPRRFLRIHLAHLSVFLQFSRRSPHRHRLGQNRSHRRGQSGVAEGGVGVLSERGVSEELLRCVQGRSAEGDRGRNSDLRRK